MEKVRMKVCVKNAKACTKAVLHDSEHTLMKGSLCDFRDGLLMREQEVHLC